MDTERKGAQKMYLTCFVVRSHSDIEPESFTKIGTSWSATAGGIAICELTFKWIVVDLPGEQDKKKKEFKKRKSNTRILDIKISFVSHHMSLYIS